MATTSAGLDELVETDLDYRVVQFPRPRSLEESAAAQGIAVGSIIKTLVVRRSEGDYLFVLVPGDRAIDWPKLRAHLGVSRLSLPDAAEAFEVTGYERGAITPLGARRRWPVIADTTVLDLDPISIGAGAHGLVIHVEGRALVTYLDAEQADITKPIA